MAHAPPPCSKVGRHCRGLGVTLRVSTFDGPPESVDHEATWLLGHTERIEFGPLVRRGQYLYARALLAVPCRYAEAGGGQIRCTAHGFRGPVPELTLGPVERQRGGDRFQYVQRGRLVEGPLLRPKRRGLPVLGSNPCASARCRTADNTIGAACCRDLQVEIVCRKANRRLESLVRSRQPPYLCKVEREGSDSLGVEMISACQYLDRADHVSCTLHGRSRPDGRSAKPELCFDWPSGDDTTFHGGCVLAPAST